MKKLNLRQLGKSLLPVSLLPLFFLLHGLNENIGLIPLGIILQLFLIYTLITVAVVALSLLLLGKVSKAVVFSFYVLSVFFLFGAFHDFLKSSISNKFLVSYSLLLPLLFVVTAVFFISLKKYKGSGSLSMRYFYYLVTAFVALEIVTLVYNEATNKSAGNNLSGKTAGWDPAKGCTVTKKPDIFFVVLDGYTSSQCLQEEFDYDNHEIDSLLAANHFFTSRSSQSNYNITPFSLSSTLNLNYLRSGLENRSIGGKAFLQAIETLKYNRLATFLGKEGYWIKNYGCFDFDGAPTLTKSYFADLYFNQIDNQTLSSRIQRDIGWNFTLKNIFTGQFRVPESYKNSKNYHLYRNNFNLNGLLTELKVQDSKPKFVYVHLMLPHEPFYLDSLGKQISDTTILLRKLPMKVGYLNQIKYCNSILKKLIPMIASSPLHDKVVIIQGDHGFRDHDPSVPVYKDFMNLNTYYFSDGDYSGLYEGISPVNSFRVILNKYFCRSLPLLKDSSIYLTKTVNGTLL